MPAYESINGFWSSDVRNICNFSRKEELLYEVWSCRGHFLLAPVVKRVQVLRSEEMLHSN